MKAIVINGFGKSNKFEVREVVKPKLQSGHLVVEIHATSVNPVDYKIRNGDLSGLAPDFPAILHGDFSGIVTEVASDIRGFKNGDRVFGCAGGLKGFSGALGEYMMVDACLTSKIPNKMTFVEAAALPLVSLTAWEALVDKVKIKETDRILILGGTGGVGHMAVQLAKTFSPHVYASVSTVKKGEIIKTLGAKDFFLHSDKNFIEQTLLSTSGEGFDIVFDTVGSRSLINAFSLVKKYGQVISCQTSGSFDLGIVLQKSLSIHGVLMLLPMLTGKNRSHHQFILDKIGELWEKGKIKPLINEKIFRFLEVAQAHDLAESGNAFGKIVISK